MDDDLSVIVDDKSKHELSDSEGEGTREGTGDMDHDGKVAEGTPSHSGDSVFTFETPEEELDYLRNEDKARRMAEAARLKEDELVRRKAMQEEEAREREKAREIARATESGRESGAKHVHGKIDHRYHAVRSLRGNMSGGRVLSAGEGQEEPAVYNGFIQDEDDRWLRNYNIHDLDRKVNVSCSFNPRSGLCYTCIGSVHSAWEGKDKEPIVIVAVENGATGRGERVGGESKTPETYTLETNGDIRPL